MPTPGPRTCPSFVPPSRPRSARRHVRDSHPYRRFPARIERRGAGHAGRLGRVAAATTAAWPSSTFVMPAASSRSSCATPRSRTGCATSTASRWSARCRAGRRATRTPTCPPATIEVMADELEVLSTAAPLPVPDRRPRRRSARRRGCVTATSTCAASSAGDAIRMRSKVNQICRDVLLAREFVEIETPTLTAVDARGRARLPRARPAAARAAGTRCPSRRSCSSSCSWWPAWSATSRSPAATATRTSAPTASRSSPSSTSRCPSSTRRT